MAAKPTPSAVTSSNLGDEMFSAAKTALGTKFKAVKQFLRDEADKMALTLKTIMAGVAAGETDKKEAKILLLMLKVSVRSVLSAAEGMTAIAVESAINAALGVVKQFVNGKVGFALL